MSNPTIEFKAREYIYDLGNIALENGFKADEHWEVNLATAAEKIAIEKKYYPTVATKLIPEILTDTFRSVKTKLHQSIKEAAQVLEKRQSPQPQLQYLVAYNPNRLRR
jgi:hypothetical protein